MHEHSPVIKYFGFSRNQKGNCDFRLKTVIVGFFRSCKRLFIFLVDVSGQLNPMALMAMSGTGGAGGGGGNGVGSMMMRLLNNPYTLCKETEGVKAIPCRTGNICNLLSMKQYRLPNLMKCSPAGIGCCLKDYMSLQLAKMMN